MMTSTTDSEKIQLSGSSAIHVGPIVTSGSNETISIVIPLSAQVATVTDQVGMNEAPSGNACNDCGKNFAPVLSTPERHGQHQAAYNSKGCPYPTCSRYGRAFSRAHDLKRHIARHEAKKERLSETVDDSVDPCARNFLSQTLLQEHGQLHERMDDSQDELQVFVCHFCKKRYGHEKKLKAHLATHNKKSISTVQCALCGLGFDEESDLQVHMKEHLGSTIETQSTLELGTESRVDMGANRNGKISASDKIRCDYCWKTFKSKWTLNSHVAAHEGRFQFDCNQCGKRFVRKSHFEGHMRSHEAARPYACDICGSTFKQLKHRREHVKRKHAGTQNAVQNLLDSISACVSEESSVDQPNFTILVPVEFNQMK